MTPPPPNAPNDRFSGSQTLLQWRRAVATNRLEAVIRNVGLYMYSATVFALYVYGRISSFVLAILDTSGAQVPSATG